MTTEETKKVTSGFLLDKLRQEGVLQLREVRNAGGHGADRSLDAMSFGLWPSKGSHATGYEVKVSRSDWLKEMTQIDKAEAFRPYCKYFFLVAVKKVAELHEIPETWGFLEWDGRRLVTVKPAPKNETVLPFPGTMLSAILKRTDDMASARGLESMKAHYETKLANFDAEVKQAVENENRYGKQEKEAIARFCAAIGVRGNYFNLDHLLENKLMIDTVKFFLAMPKDDIWNHPLGAMNTLISRLSAYVEPLEQAKILQLQLSNIADKEALEKSGIDNIGTKL